MDHRKQLAAYIHDQLGTTEEILNQWETEKYPADGTTIAKFWNYINQAPAVMIVGDYDCDGICATHIMRSAIQQVCPQKTVKVRIPRRFSEGYGINQKIANEIYEFMPKGSVVITVDNGITAAPLLEDLEQKGYTVLMTDHHQARDGIKIPQTTMVIDPEVDTLQNPLTGNYWCGAAVAYKLVEPMISEQLSTELSVYAGLATVADCMELKEGNWGIVRNALKIFHDKKAPIALSNLLIEMNQDPDFCKEDDFGYYLGPAFNAPGRLLDQGAERMLTYLQNPTIEGVKDIIALNDKRKTIRDEQTEKVIQYLEENGHANDCPIWVNMEGLHEGIIGIIAGNIAEHYQRPAIIMTTTEQEGIIKGSARSYGSFHVFQYLSSIAETEHSTIDPNENIFVRMGGHAGAAGLSMREADFEVARSHQISLENCEEITDHTQILMAIEKWEIPGIDTVLDRFRPFGQGNTSPQFEIEIDTVNDHVKMIGAQENHLSINAGKYKVMHFYHTPNELINPSHFGLRGKIAKSAFRHQATPQFTADEAFDLEERA